jgi:hypothetical protein
VEPEWLAELGPMFFSIKVSISHAQLESLGGKRFTASTAALFWGQILTPYGVCCIGLLSWCVTAVEPEWLAELGPMFFSIKVGPC